MCIFSLDFFLSSSFSHWYYLLRLMNMGSTVLFFFLSNLFLYQSQKSPYTWLYFFNLIISSIIITIFPTAGFISAGAGFFFFLFPFSTICSIGYWYKKAIGISGVWLFFFSSLISLHCLIHFRLFPFLHSVFSSFFQTLNTFFFSPKFSSLREKPVQMKNIRDNKQQNQQRRPGFGSSFFSPSLQEGPVDLVQAWEIYLFFIYL